MNDMPIKVKIIIAFVVVAAIGLVVFAFYFTKCLSPQITIQGTTPTEGASVVSPDAKIVFNFSGDIDINAVVIETSPAFEYDSNFDAKSLTLTITPKTSLQEKVDYKVILKKQGMCTKITNLQSGDYTLSFRTSYSVSNTDWGKAKENLLVSTAWPIETAKFNIDYWSSSDAFLVLINVDPCEKNKEAALDWFRNKNINPEKLNIIWTVGKNVANECF